MDRVETDTTAALCVQIDSATTKRSPLATATFVLGVISLIPVLSLWTAIPTLVIGAIELHRIAHNPALSGGKRLVTVSIVFAAIGLMLTIIPLHFIFNMRDI